MQLNVIGSFFQTLALLSSLACFAAGLYGALKRKGSFSEFSRLASLGTFLFTAIATVILVIAFLTNDYSIHYVWQFSNRDMPSVYKVAALWGGMNGSMLFWAFLLFSLGRSFGLYSQRLSKRGN